MARHILIVEQSLTMRKILQGMILANINDAVLDEAWTVSDAVEKVKESLPNLILYSIDSSMKEWKGFFKEISAEKVGKKIPLILLTSKPDAKYVKDALAEGADGSLAIPCNPEVLVSTIDGACNPVTLRFARRYSIPGSTVKIEQRHYSFEGKLLNISKGGLLCEWAWSDGFQIHAPAMISINFAMESEPVEVGGFFSALVNLFVSESHSDFSPKKIRTALKFINPTEDNMDALEEVFRMADSEQKLLDA